jgi:hypothetical protein
VAAPTRRFGFALPPATILTVSVCVYRQRRPNAARPGRTDVSSGTAWATV